MAETKAEFIKTLKEVAEERGEAIGTKDLVSVMQNVTTAVTQQVEFTTQQAVRSLLPSVEADIQKIADLLKSNSDDDQERALDNIKNLQEKAGINLLEFNDELRKNIEKMGDILRERKQERQEQARIRQEKKYELAQEQEILRQKGINTIVDEKNMSLKVMTFKEEQLEKQRILEFEEALKQKTIDYIKEEKVLRTKQQLTQEDQETILNNRREILADEKELADRRETLGMNTGDQRMSGPIGETIGAAVDQFKNLGSELKQIGKDIGGTFAGVIGGLKGFGKGIMAVGATFRKLITAMLPAIFAFLALAAPVILVIAGVIGLITAIGTAAKALANLNPMNWFKNKLKKSEETKKNALNPNQLQNDLGDPLSEGFEMPDMGDFQKILPNQQSYDTNTGDTDKSPISFKKNELLVRSNNRLNTNLNTESAALNASERTSSNIVVAPNQNNQTINQSGSTVMSTDSKNIDNTFLNLSDSIA